MNKLFKIFLFSSLAYANISCFCSGRKLTAQLVKDSELIFEGKLTKVDTIPDETDVLLTFKVAKVFKGESKKHFIVRSSRGSCGFTSYKWRYRVLGKTYLAYLTKEEGQYVYAYCTNRIAWRKLHEDDMGYAEGENFRETNRKYLIEYKKEIKTLDSLLTIK